MPISGLCGFSGFVKSRTAVHDIRSHTARICTALLRAVLSVFFNFEIFIFAADKMVVVCSFELFPIIYKLRRLIIAILIRRVPFAIDVVLTDDACIQGALLYHLG